MSTLRKLQLTQFYILLEVKRICEKYKLQYFLVGGTLLGAVRHQGFIPWDDDIDIGMLREDYEKFLQVCPQEVSDEFYLQTIHTDSKCIAVSTKLRLNGTSRKDAGSVQTEAHCGIDIDIFPFDNFPSNPILQFYQYYRGMMLRGMLDAKMKGVLLNRENSLVKKIGWKVSVFFAHFYSRDAICKKIDEHFPKYNMKETEYVICSGGAYHYSKESFPKFYVSRFVQLSFEGFMFPVPEQYHDYLSNQYGDYMQFPPEDARIPHVIVELDLGKYENIAQILNDKYGVLIK